MTRPETINVPDAACTSNLSNHIHDLSWVCIAFTILKTVAHPWEGGHSICYSLTSIADRSTYETPDRLLTLLLHSNRAYCV